MSRFSFLSALFVFLALTLATSTPESFFILETGTDQSPLSEKITPLNADFIHSEVPLFESVSTANPLPQIIANPNLPLPSQGTELPDHLTAQASRILTQPATLVPLSSPGIQTTAEVEAVSRLKVLWGQYMKTENKDNPTYQTYMNWAAELGANTACLERYMGCTTWCEQQGQTNSQFINCDPNRNGKQFIPGDPNECPRPLHDPPTDPTQPWPGGFGCP